MDSFDSDDSVKEEKPNAIGRYTLFLNIAKLLQFIEFLIAVALISWSSSRLFPLLKLSGVNLLTFSSNLFNQHIVFLVGNVIIVVCYVLSRHTEEGNKSEKCDEKDSSSNQQKTINDTSIGESVTPSAKETQGTEETAGEENPNQEGRYENAIVKTESVTAVETAIKEAAKQIERFRRTQSEKLKREISIKPRRKLQRSATGRRSSLVVTSVDGSSAAISLETVEKLSNEEFRLAVETFITKQQSFLKQQGMAENGTIV